MTNQTVTMFSAAKRAVISTCNMVAEAAEAGEALAKTGKVYANDLLLDAESSSRINEAERKKLEASLKRRPSTKA